ncbi:MAG: hypothetical protein ACTSUZ_11430 [Candidatus Thorarchaeota archaeon]
MVDEQESEDSRNRKSEPYLVYEYGEKLASLVAYCDSPQKVSHLSKKFDIDEAALGFWLKQITRKGIMKIVDSANDKVPLYQAVRDVEYPPVNNDRNSTEYSEIRIALFGSIGAGKSTILHSLFAPPITPPHYERIRRFNVPEHIFKTCKSIAFFNLLSRKEGQLGLLKVVQPDLIIIVTDSRKDDINETKKYIPRVQELFPEAQLIALANKQDLPDTIPPDLVQEELEIPTFGTIAFEISFSQEHRILLTKVIADSLGLTLDILGETGQWPRSNSFTCF